MTATSFADLPPKATRCWGYWVWPKRRVRHWRGRKFVYFKRGTK